MKKWQFHFRRAIKLSVSSATRGGEKGRRNSHRRRWTRCLEKKERELTLWGWGWGGS